MEKVEFFQRGLSTILVKNEKFLNFLLLKKEISQEIYFIPCIVFRETKIEIEFIDCLDRKEGFLDYKDLVL